jgi:uncharacterized protein (TIGR03437 family)
VWIQFRFCFASAIQAAAWVVAMGFATVLPAQDQITATQISTGLPDAYFQVDGQWYMGSAQFSWPGGSTHLLNISAVQYSGAGFKTRYLFSAWSSSNGPLDPAPTPVDPGASNQVIITADPGVTWYLANLTVESALTLSFYPCMNVPQSPGRVYVNHVGYDCDTDVWFPPGSTVLLEAVPNDGRIFGGWQQGADLPVIYSFMLNAPTIVYPKFVPARAINLSTSPDGLQLLADRAVVWSPSTLEWGWTTQHTVGVVSPQRDKQGVLWLFQSWSDGGDLTHSYQVGSLETPASLTAQFARAVGVSLLTEPLGLSVLVDGASLKTPVNLEWLPGSVHTIGAPSMQNDAGNAPWALRAWSNGGTPSQTIQVNVAQADTGIRLTAIYDPLSGITVDTAPSGLPLTVDGFACRTPCTVDRVIGSTVKITAPASVPGTDGVRYDFAAWDGASDGVVQAKAGAQKVTARYNTLYRLAWSSRPANAGAWQFAPLTSDGFFLAGASVSAGFAPATGWQFQNWELDLSGTANPTTVVMTAPRSIRAVAAPLPPIPAPPTVLSTATGTTAVSPGSLATLYGTNLADATSVAPSGPNIGPLPQVLGGVTLVCSGRLLPLLYVSPQQINFVLATGIDPGPQKLEVHRQSGPILTVDFTVVRTAPGLFAVVHEDGTPVNVASPAGSGELLLVLGTGFGAYQSPLPAGFPAPDNPPDPLVDSLQLVLGGQAVALDFAGAAPGLTGIAQVRFRVPDGLGPGAPVDLAVTIGDATSNMLSLPVN